MCFHPGLYAFAFSDYWGDLWKLELVKPISVQVRIEIYSKFKSVFSFY